MTTLLTRTPFHMVWGGREAVILFFVLSGFVLSLPFWKNDRNHPYFGFAVKRVTRIYIPYLFSVIVASLLRFKFSGGVPHLSENFNSIWTGRIDWATVALDHLLMLGQTTRDLNPVTWSLVHELRLSLAFPLIIWAVRRVKWTTSLALALSLSLTGIMSGKIIPVFELNRTLHYAAFFVLGALLAKHRETVFRAVRESTSPVQYGLLSVGLILYSWKAVSPDWPFFHHGLVVEWAVAVGSLVFISISLSSLRVKTALEHPWLVHLGKVSFSLYLIHGLILISVGYLIPKGAPLVMATIAVPFLSVAVATAIYRFVEVPSIELGRRLTFGQANQGKEPIRTVV